MTNFIETQKELAREEMRGMYYDDSDEFPRLLDTLITQVIQNTLEEVGKVVKKEKSTWGNQSIGYKAVESVEMAIKESLLAEMAHPPQEQGENVNTPDTEKCKHNVVGKFCFRCKRPDLACRCNCLNFYKIECDCPCHSQVEIEQNAETGEILAANGIDLTPQKKGGWEEDFELCFRYFFMDMADGAVKHDIKCFIRTLLTSRDTYWKERVRKEVEGWADQYTNPSISAIEKAYKRAELVTQIKTELLQALDKMK